MSVTASGIPCALLTLLDALRSSQKGDLTTAHIGAGPHERSENRTNQRTGHRPETLTTADGDLDLDLDLRILKVRVGSFFPSLLERAADRPGPRARW